MEQLVAFFKKTYLKLPVIAFDIVSIPVAWYLAYLLQYNLQTVTNLIKLDSLKVLAVLMCVQISCYYTFKVYRGLWRFSSLNDVARIIKSIGAATTFTIPILYSLSWLNSIPRSVFPLYALLLITLLCSGRLYFRSRWDQRNKNTHIQNRQRVLIVGAGQAGESIVRDLKRTNTYVPIGFIDDSPLKRGLEVHGVRVIGTVPQLPELVNKHNIQLILIAIPSAGSVSMRRIVRYCERSMIPFRTLPSLYALASGHVEVNALRRVNIEDLLGRDQVTIQWDKLADSIQDKAVLVTGGGGSIGSELCRQILNLNPKKLLILDNNEFNLYKIEQEVSLNFPQIQISIALISVTDTLAIEETFNQFKPEIVFHAAAYKHVPLLEEQIRIAVYNNVIGTQIVAEASVAIGAKKFILISTDKAVNPTNIMGMTKRVAEIYCQNLNERVQTQFITVRFGNVLGSMGSVVPLFQKQLEKGGPLTVTHPEMQRYFMTIPEASQLILQAMANGQGGEIFVLDMGEPIKISYLAEQMIRLAGKIPGKDIQIKYTGLRRGEKLFEELFHASEELIETDHAKLFKAKFRRIEWNQLMQSLHRIHQACQNLQHNDLLTLLTHLVPEYSGNKIAELEHNEI